MSKKLTVEVINKLIGVNDSYKAPEKLMSIMLNKEEREKLFRSFLEIETDVNEDWFHMYFQDEHADRKVKKQDFTPVSITQLLSELSVTNNDNGMRLDVAAGTGGLTITKWNNDRINTNFFEYKPRMFMYVCEELSDRAIPFLLFNLAIRGMDAVVLHGDTLTREFNQCYFIQNDYDNFLGFSSINIMPQSIDVMEMYDIRDWLEEENIHIESPTMDQLPMFN